MNCYYLGVATDEAELDQIGRILSQRLIFTIMKTGLIFPAGIAFVAIENCINSEESLN